MDLWAQILAALVYIGCGAALLITSAWVIDLITPGRLMDHVFGGKPVVVTSDGQPVTQVPQPPSASAALVLAAAMIGQGLVAFTTIWTNASSSFGSALGWTIAFGLVGIVTDAVAILLVDFLTPGRLVDVVCTPGRIVPAAAVAAAVQLAVAGIVVASIA